MALDTKLQHFTAESLFGFGRQLKRRQNYSI
jgi:hypothetical protein